MDVEVTGVREEQYDEVREEEPTLVVLCPEQTKSGVGYQVDVIPLVVPDTVHPVMVNQPEVGDRGHGQDNHSYCRG